MFEEYFKGLYDKLTKLGYSVFFSDEYFLPVFTFNHKDSSNSYYLNNNAFTFVEEKFILENYEKFQNYSLTYKKNGVDYLDDAITYFSDFFKTINTEQRTLLMAETYDLGIKVLPPEFLSTLDSKEQITDAIKNWPILNVSDDCFIIDKLINQINPHSTFSFSNDEIDSIIKSFYQTNSYYLNNDKSFPKERDFLLNFYWKQPEKLDFFASVSPLLHSHLNPTNELKFFTGYDSLSTSITIDPKLLRKEILVDFLYLSQYTTLSVKLAECIESSYDIKFINNQKHYDINEDYKEDEPFNLIFLHHNPELSASFFKELLTNFFSDLKLLNNLTALLKEDSVGAYCFKTGYIEPWLKQHKLSYKLKDIPLQESAKNKSKI